MTDPRTYGDALRWASSFLLAHAETLSWHRLPEDERRAAARAEAETLVRWVSGRTRLGLLTGLADPLPKDVREALREAAGRRIAGEPLQYITGEAPFYGRLFAVRPGCLIPRPETERLVEVCLSWGQSQGGFGTVCDVGTGSGAIAITLALERPDADVWAVDVSDDALAIARENARRHGARVRFVRADALTWLRDEAPRLQVIIANPPYIPSEDIDRLAPEVRTWEPRLALDGGPDGLGFYGALAALGPVAFRTDGPNAIFLEVGQGQAEAVMGLFTGETGWRDWSFRVEEDLRGVPRVVWGERVKPE
ncbi:peptide chain release factor N(5)-glutamine methyltransferase [Alicyclobacillus sp.]|uniref:peptide chain release factor N(5)-glutamine methyltransferase n=1 Tax=Alicyclobacillus sp. TaxID=61169 RepID=UPI0025C5C09C|nr:peptide chain release factor N(5)-glutamine methyltransferase [Alicyclobacillus sp.]MCL6515850.1 peptide chain release factor N(5)-glutamine methyltransferase [Alicyclobacillus sp.]